jgi:ATP-dependent Clp protease ATP-binding subunit ClpA
MSRLIQDTIRKALADELLFGRLTNGGRVTIDLEGDDKVKLVFEEAPAEAEPVA